MTSNQHNQTDADRSIKRIKSLLLEELPQAEMVETLNRENYKTLRGLPWTIQNLRVVLHRLRRDLATWYQLSRKRANLSLEALV